VRRSRHAGTLGLACVATLAASACNPAGTLDHGGPATVRIATFNIQELSMARLTTVDGAGTGLDPQAVAAAKVILYARPDILVLNEIDIVWPPTRVP